MPVRMLSVCSGLGGAELATADLDWETVACAEIDPFASAILAHRFPQVKNLGDFTKIDVTTLPPIDVLIGGPPCQGFSVAGKGLSLQDTRGVLILDFVRLAHELVRHHGGITVVFENVPGILVREDNPFGLFLGLLVGHDSAFAKPHGASWTGAGMADGPRGRCAWRILDAQFWNLAQRRERVFVVASLGASRIDPAAILFERASLRGNHPPRREARQGTARGLAPSLTSSGRGVERVGESRGQDPVIPELVGAIQGGGTGVNRQSARSGYILPAHPQAGAAGTGPATEPQPVIGLSHEVYAGNAEGGAADVPFLTAANLGKTINNQTPLVAGAVSAKWAKQSGGPAAGDEAYNLIAVREEAVAYNIYPKGGQGADLEVRETDIAMGVLGEGGAKQIDRGTRIVEPMTFSERGRDDGCGVEARQDGLADAVRTPSHARPSQMIAEPLAFDTTQLTHPANYSNPQPGDPCHALPSNGHPPAVAFKASHYTRDKDGAPSEVAPPLSADADKGDQDTLIATQAVAFDLRNGAVGDVAMSVQSGGMGDERGRCINAIPHVAEAVAFDLRGREGGSQAEGPHDTANLRAASGGSSRSYVAEIAGTFAVNSGPRGHDSGNLMSNQAVDAGYIVAHQRAVRRLTPRETERLPEGPHDTANIRAASGGSSRSYIAQGVDLRNIAISDEAPSVLAEAGGASRNYVAAFQERTRAEGPRLEHQEDLAYALMTPTGGGKRSDMNIVQQWAVRRLTPRETERLQGLPDGHTNVPWRGKLDAPDGPRYRAVGNAWAVPVVRWICQRIDAQLAKAK